MQQSTSSINYETINKDRISNSEMALNLSKDMLQSQQLRLKSILSKSQTLATLASIVMTAFSIVSVHSDHAAFLRIIGIEISFFCLILFLYILKSNPNLEAKADLEWNDETLMQDSSQIKLKLVHSYQEVLQRAKTEIDIIQRVYNYTIVSLTIVFIIGVFVSYFEYLQYIT